MKEIVYELTAYVDGERVYKISSPLLEVIEMSLETAEKEVKNVTEEDDGLTNNPE
jgi:hypothetical protein